MKIFYSVKKVQINNRGQSTEEDTVSCWRKPGEPISTLPRGEHIPAGSG